MTLYKIWKFREHRPWDKGLESYVEVGFAFQQDIPRYNRCIRMDTGALDYGCGYFFKTFPKHWLQGKKLKVKYRWMGQDFGSTPYHKLYIRLWDGEYSETNDLTFPDCAPMVFQGAGVVQTLRERGSTDGYYYWYEETFNFDVSTSELGYVTLVFHVQDEQCNISSNGLHLLIEYIQILNANNQVVKQWDFETGSIIMSRDGTKWDYGAYYLDQETPDFPEPDIPTRIDDVEILSSHLKGVKDVQWRDSSPWVEIEVPAGNIIHHHLKGTKIEGTISCYDMSSLYAIFYNTEIGESGKYPVDPNTGEKTKFSTLGDQFRVTIKSFTGQSYRFDFYDVRIETIDLKTPEEEYGGESIWQIQFTARWVKRTTL